MRSVQLQPALAQFLEEAAALLEADVAGGAEVGFELEPRRAGSFGGASLYCYRALTGEFLAERQGRLERLPGYAEAVRQLEGFDGLDRYLAGLGADGVAGDPRKRSRVAVGMLLREVFDEQTTFELRPERLQAAFEGLERSALADSGETTIVATLHGLTISSPEVTLATGLTIAHPQELQGLPETTLASADGHLVVALTSDDPDPQEAIARGREVLRDLLRALRLFGDGRVTLGALAWTRVAGGRWSALALGAGGRPHGMLVVTAEQEDELRAFCNLVSRRAPHCNELAWALRRFELGCERESVFEALSDHLLALRALLEPEGPASGLLAGRLAALCATPERRLELTERTVRALALEREIVAGTAVQGAGAHALAGDIGDHLRALLRDVVCGHLDPDLAGLADELLLSATAGGGASQDPAEDGSAQQVPRDPLQAQEILDVFI